MVINLYAGPHKAGDMYVSISTPLNPGETFYFRQSTGSIEADRCEVDHITESFFECDRCEKIFREGLFMFCQNCGKERVGDGAFCP